MHYVKCPHNKCWEGKRNHGSVLKGYSPWGPERSVNLIILKPEDNAESVNCQDSGLWPRMNLGYSHMAVQISLCYNGRHVWPNDGSQLRTQDCNFYILAKAQTVSFATVAIMNGFVQVLNLLYKTLSYLCPQPFVHSEMTQKLGMVLHTCCPTFGRQRKEDLEFQVSLWDLAQETKFGVGQTEHL